jgi:hypothetical protein
MQRKPFDAATALDLPPPPEPFQRPPAGPPTDFMRTVSEATMKDIDVARKVQEEQAKLQVPPPPDWVLFVGEWLVVIAVGTYVATCLVYISIFGMVMKTEIIQNVRLATLVGAAELFGVFETVKCVVIAAVQLMVHKSNAANDVITKRKLRMLEKKQHLERRQAGMKTMLVQQSGGWLWRRAGWT